MHICYVCNYASMQVFNYAIMQISKFASMQEFMKGINAGMFFLYKYAIYLCLPVYKYTGMQSCTYTSMHLCKYASMLVGI